MNEMRMLHSTIPEIPSGSFSFATAGLLPVAAILLIKLEVLSLIKTTEQVPAKYKALKIKVEIRGGKKKGAKEN